MPNFSHCVLQNLQFQNSFENTNLCLGCSLMLARCWSCFQCRSWLLGSLWRDLWPFRLRWSFHEGCRPHFRRLTSKLLMWILGFRETFCKNLEWVASFEFSLGLRCFHVKISKQTIIFLNEMSDFTKNQQVLKYFFKVSLKSLRCFHGKFQMCTKICKAAKNLFKSSERQQQQTFHGA